MNRDLNKEKPLCRGVEAGAPGRELQGQRLGHGAQSTSGGQLGQCGWRVGVGVQGELGRVGTDPWPWASSSDPRLFLKLVLPARTWPLPLGGRGPGTASSVKSLLPVSPGCQAPVLRLHLGLIPSLRWG